MFLELEFKTKMVFGALTREGKLIYKYLIIVLGCMDSLAFNFNPAADTSNGGCCYISGCTDITALNLIHLLVLMMVLVTILLRDVPIHLPIIIILLQQLMIARVCILCLWLYRYIRIKL